MTKSVVEMSRAELVDFLEAASGIKVPDLSAPKDKLREWYAAYLLVIFTREYSDTVLVHEKLAEHLPEDEYRKHFA